jgi:hypothetical protein
VADARVEGFGISVDLDSNSNIVGSSDTNLTSGKKVNEVYFVAKYAPDGRRLSIKEVDRSGSVYIGRAISLGNNGYNFVAGLTRELATPSSHDNYFISKSKE